MASGQLRMTGPTRAVLETLLADPDAVHYGLAIGAATALPSGTVHPILARLEGLAWVTSTWEDIQPADAGRPRRRLYRLTDDGLAKARSAVASAHAKQARLTGRAPAAARPQGAMS